MDTSRLKTCTRCKSSKAISEFHVRKERRCGYQSRCKTCLGDINKQWKRCNAEYVADYSRQAKLRRNYRLSKGQYQEMYEAQKGQCAICHTEESQCSGRWKRLMVDHCHATGKIRGLLCHPCNVSIGAMKDSPELLASAIAYLGAA